jgi:flagellar biosynthesis protein FlhF
MKVRRFTATSMQKALKTVRDEMGADAVILSNHRVNGGVEIIVAQNYEPISAKKSAPIFNAEEDDSHLPSPTFSSEGKKTKGKKSGNKKHSKKDESPWPFLSAAERTDVEDQLKLQDQLEALKIQRDNNGVTADLGQVPDSKADQQAGAAQQSSKSQRKQIQEQQPLQQVNTGTLTHPAHHGALHQTAEGQSELQKALDEMKHNRQDYHQINQSHSNNVADINASISAPLSDQDLNPNKQILDDVRSELNDLKEMLMATAESSSKIQTEAESRISADNVHRPESFIWKKYSPSNPLQAKLWRRFENMGFDEWLSYQLVNHLDDHDDEKASWQACLQDLTQHISISPSDRLKRGGIFALVGPTGAGKTTTIAKMAVRYTLEHEGAKVGLITMDNYRLAAHDQLRTLGQILGVPVQVADQDHCLTKCIDELAECDLILIDTAGLTSEHPMLEYQLDQLAQIKNKINTLLVMSATNNSRVLRKMYHNYKAAGLVGCVVTKVDEASSLGDVISVLLETGLDLSYSTDGQRIPDDIQIANAKGMVKQAVKIAQQEQQLARESGTAQGAW